MRVVPERLIAIDWSGSQNISRQKKTIWIADWRERTCTLTVERGRTRRQVVDYVLGAASETPSLVAGFDFAFSFPEDFTRGLRCKTVEELWEAIRKVGPDWMRGGWPEEFYVIKGRQKPAFFLDGGRQHLRATDVSCNAKSIFELGAGGVGWGSIAGQPFLHEMWRNGFAIWPFHKAQCPIAIEIYPACYWRELSRRTPEERVATLGYPDFSWIPERAKLEAIRSRDAFDALISLAAMRAYGLELTSLKPTSESTILIEGLIWQPNAAQPQSPLGPVVT